MIFLQLPTCSQPLGLPLLLPLFVPNGRELNDILSTKWLQRLARPFLCPFASMTAEARVYKCALLGSAKREAVSDCLRSREVTSQSVAEDQSSLAWETRLAFRVRFAPWETYTNLSVPVSSVLGRGMLT